MPARVRSSQSAGATLVVALAALSGLSVTTGCVMPDQVSQLQRDVADVRDEMRGVREEQVATSERLERLENRLGSSNSIEREEFADMRADLDQIARSVAVVEERIADTNRRMDGLSQSLQEVKELTRRQGSVASQGDLYPRTPSDLGEGGGPAGGGPATATGALPDPQELYNASYADFSKGNYELAIAGFQEYATRFPDSDLADNALFWVGECHYSQGDFDRAVEWFDRVLGQYPDSDRAAAADLKKGLAYLEQNKIGAAIVQLRHVLDKYPSSDESRVARDKLASLGASVN